MTNNTPPPSKPRNNLVLWLIALLLFLLLACGACTLLMLSPLGGEFWRGFMDGLNSNLP
jgi:heme A synthase